MATSGAKTFTHQKKTPALQATSTMGKQNKTKGVDKRDNAQKVMEMYDSNNNIHGDVYLQFFQ